MYLHSHTRVNKDRAAVHTYWSRASFYRNVTSEPKCTVSDADPSMPENHEDAVLQHHVPSAALTCVHLHWNQTALCQRWNEIAHLISVCNCSFIQATENCYALARDSNSLSLASPMLFWLFLEVTIVRLWLLHNYKPYLWSPWSITILTWYQYYRCT